jgi:hypothetical protein
VPTRCLCLFARSLIFVFFKTADARKPRQKNEGFLWRACVAAGRCWLTHKIFQQTGGKKFTPSHNVFRLAGKNHKHKTSRTKANIYVFPLPQKRPAQWCPSFCRPSRETAPARPPDAPLIRPDAGFILIRDQLP